MWHACQGHGMNIMLVSESHMEETIREMRDMKRILVLLLNSLWRPEWPRIVSNRQTTWATRNSRDAYKHYTNFTATIIFDTNAICICACNTCIGAVRFTEHQTEWLDAHKPWALQDITFELQSLHTTFDFPWHLVHLLVGKGRGSSNKPDYSNAIVTVAVTCTAE